MYSRVSPQGDAIAYMSTFGSDAVPTLKVRRLPGGPTVEIDRGFDGYWSPDGERLFYLEVEGDRSVGSVAYPWARKVVSDVVDGSLGDYYSWGGAGSRDLIMTIKGHYFRLTDKDVATEHRRMPRCPRFGIGDRPLLSRDGRRVSVFFQNTIIIRNPGDCRNIIDTGVIGAKADFSPDGRFVATHALVHDRYQIIVIDLKTLGRFQVTTLPGWSYFPSWTLDGSIVFRYMESGFNGFAAVSPPFVRTYDSASVARPVLPEALDWAFAIVEQPPAPEEWTLVIVGDGGCAHCVRAVGSMREASRLLRVSGLPVSLGEAVGPDPQKGKHGPEVGLRHLTLTSSGIVSSGILNQVPSYMLFNGPRLIERRLGEQTVDELAGWVQNAAVPVFKH